MKLYKYLYFLTFSFKKDFTLDKNTLEKRIKFKATKAYRLLLWHKNRKLNYKLNRINS